ncbi:uncharacterized protein LOC115397407 isoform X2 [Salarias fasciatus]|uniref:uncharacterized protein LOC115397407 isoform X2 n=1 Tax=Salarias fasciatus TaxID=181472 RepID=UPI001176BAE3|nr:uncharacterized protein LOC115397407 isoform X2 [Salarias fasciatus]
MFTKGSTIHTMPCLSKQLKGMTDHCIIGLQYIWEYRSPSKSVPPHYQCKLCSLIRLQHDMLDHIKGWKHGFRYMKKAHPDKVTCEEEDAIKDPVIRKAVKDAAAEVEQTEGRGQIRVILKEPCDVPAFKGLRSAVPRPGPSPGLGLMGPPPFGPRFPGDFPHGGPPGEYPLGEYREPGFGGYANRPDFSESGLNRRPFPEGTGRHPGVGGNGFGPGGGRDGFGRSGLLDDSPGKMYPDEYRGGPMGKGLLNKPMDKPLDRPGLMGAAPDSHNLQNTLLTYLDTFRIENESDAQLVLKVTQKLTDVLMEYRLRTVSAGSSFSSLSMTPPTFQSTPPRLSGGTSRYSNSFSGPSKYSDSPAKYYK